MFALLSIPGKNKEKNKFQRTLVKNSGGKGAALTMNCFHMDEEIFSSELLPNKIHVTPNTKIPQTNLNADLEKNEE